MLMCVLFNQRYGAAFSASAGAGPMVAMILSNQSAPAYLPGSVQAEQNNLPADAFRWTSRRGSAPGAASLSQPRERHNSHERRKSKVQPGNIPLRDAAPCRRCSAGLTG